jgi:hypothetical protein
MAIPYRDIQIHRRVFTGAWFASESRNEVSKTCIVPLYIGYRYTVKRYNQRDGQNTVEGASPRRTSS